MKIIPFSILLMLLLMFWYRPCLAQNSNVHAKVLFVEPYELQVTTNKTTSLIFPYSIKSVDRGSADLLVQEAKGIDNILRLKAARENFAETNLTVITSEGNLYSFIINYDKKPSLLTISFGADTLSDMDQREINKLAAIPESGTSEAGMISTAEKLLRISKSSVHGAKDRYYKMKLSLNGLFVQRDVIYCQIRCRNSSNIDYDVDMLRFYLRDRRRSKRTASQEIELKPLYIADNTTLIRGKTRAMCVVALPKFTIPDGKYLAIEMKEKNGGRNLLLKVHNRHIIRASVIKAL